MKEKQNELKEKILKNMKDASFLHHMHQLHRRTIHLSCTIETKSANISLNNIVLHGTCQNIHFITIINATMIIQLIKTKKPM